MHLLVPEVRVQPHDVRVSQVALQVNLLLRRLVVLSVLQLRLRADLECTVLLVGAVLFLSEKDVPKFALAEILPQFKIIDRPHVAGGGRHLYFSFLDKFFLLLFNYSNLRIVSAK